MDAGSGIGGFSKNQKEMVESKFDLFSNVEVETGVKKLILKLLDLFLLLQAKDHIPSSFQLILKNLQMLEVFVSMEKCVLKRKILMDH